MIVYRLANEKYARDLSGKGAEITGGRWNYRGTRLLYTADSRALCMAEIAVHTPVGVMPKDYYLILIEIPDILKFEEILVNDLPKDWRKFPYLKATQEIGVDFVEKNRMICLKVPSAVVPGDYNLLINPSHPDFEKIKIISTEKFDFDERLFR